MKSSAKITLGKAVAVVVVLMMVATSVIFLMGDKGEEDTLVVAISSDVKNWYNKQFADGDARFVWSQIYGTLLRLDNDLNLVPGLAESYEPIGEDGKIWEFKLREGVKFHDGSDFDAEAVLFSYRDGIFVKTYGVLRPVEEIVAVDSHTVRFIMKDDSPMGSLPYYLTHVAWPIMSPNMADGEGEWNGKVIGTGPFKFVSESPEEIVLERNEEYYEEDYSDLKKIRFKVLPDPSARKNALKAGDVDMILKVSENDVAELQKKPWFTLGGSGEITVNIKQTTFTDFLQFNTVKEERPFSDVNVRRAVARIIDSEAIVESLLKGHGEAARGRAISPIMDYVDEDLELLERDLAEAATYMETAGWEKGSDGFYYKNGEKFSATLILSSVDAWAARFTDMAEYISAALREAGMEVQVKPLDPGSFESHTNEKNFDMILRSGYFVWGPYPRHFFLHDSMQKDSYYNDAGYDSLSRAADATVDEEERRDLYYDLQEHVIDKLPALYLVHEVKIVAHSESVIGYEISAEDPWLNLKGVSVVR